MNETEILNLHENWLKSLPEYQSCTSKIMEFTENDVIIKSTIDNSVLDGSIIVTYKKERGIFRKRFERKLLRYTNNNKITGTYYSRSIDNTDNELENMFKFINPIEKEGKQFFNNLEDIKQKTINYLNDNKNEHVLTYDSSSIVFPYIVAEELVENYYTVRVFIQNMRALGTPYLQFKFQRKNNEYNNYDFTEIMMHIGNKRYTLNTTKNIWDEINQYNGIIVDNTIIQDIKNELIDWHKKSPNYVDSDIRYIGVLEDVLIYKTVIKNYMDSIQFNTEVILNDDNSIKLISLKYFNELYEQPITLSKDDCWKKIRNKLGIPLHNNGFEEYNNKPKIPKIVSTNNNKPENIDKLKRYSYYLNCAKITHKLDKLDDFGFFIEVKHNNIHYYISNEIIYNVKTNQIIGIKENIGNIEYMAKYFYNDMYNNSPTINKRLFTYLSKYYLNAFDLRKPIVHKEKILNDINR